MAGSPAPTRMVGELVDFISGAPFKSKGTVVKCLSPAVPLSGALTLASIILPFLTFYAITDFLLGGNLGVCFWI